MADRENGKARGREPPEGFLKPGYITYRGKTGKMWEQLQKWKRDQDQDEAVDGQ